jgi:hypothetical protein
MALTPGKAKKMLSDGTVHGQSLSNKQKRYFGAIAGGATPMKAINGGWLDKFEDGGSLPKAQDGWFNDGEEKEEELIPNLTDEQKRIKEYNINYYESDKFKTRLKNMHEDYPRYKKSHYLDKFKKERDSLLETNPRKAASIDRTISTIENRGRFNGLEVADYYEPYDVEQASKRAVKAAKENSNVVTYNDKYDSHAGFPINLNLTQTGGITGQIDPTKPSNPDEVFSHEFSHNVEFPYTERFEDAVSSKMTGALDDHDEDVEETRADLGGLRYFLNKAGIYDASKEDFTPEHLKKASEKLKDNDLFNRLRTIYSNDEDFIWTMNKMASTNNLDSQTSNISMAEDGTEIPKAQTGDKYTIVPEDGIELDEVVITGKSNKRKKKDKIREELFKDMPDFMKYGDDDYTLSAEQQQQLDDLGITDLDSYNEYFGTSYDRENAGNEFNYLNSYKPEREEMISSIHGATNAAGKNILEAASYLIPTVRGASLLSKTPQALKYIANSPVGKAAYKYIGKPFRKALDYKPGGGPFSVGNYADMGSVGYGAYNIAPDVKELYNNPSWSNAGSVGIDALGFTPFLNKKFTGPLKNTLLPNFSDDVANLKNAITGPLNKITNPLSDFRVNLGKGIERFKTQGNVNARPFWKGFNENPVPSAAKFDKDWVSAPGFDQRYDKFVYRHQDPRLLDLQKSNDRLYNSGMDLLRQKQPDLFAQGPSTYGSQLTMPLSQISKMFPRLKLDADMLMGIKRQNAGILNTLDAAKNASMNLDQISATGKFTKVFNTNSLSPDDLKYFEENSNVLGFFRNSENRAIINEDQLRAYYGNNPSKLSAYMRSVINHENSHALDAGARATKPLYNNTTRAAIPEIVDDGKNVLTGVTQKNIEEVWPGFKNLSKKRQEKLAYLSEPTEVVARIKELRSQFIPKKFVGTDKQYEMSDDLIKKIMSEGKKGNTSVDATFFRLIKDKEAFKNLFKVLPAVAAPIAIGAGQQRNGGSIPKAQIGDKVAAIASSMEANEEDGGRPPLGVVDHMRALFDEEGLCRDNTCVQTVKDFYTKAGIDTIPKDVYNNREFLKNYKEYGFEEVDQKNLQPGDVLQYYYGPDSEDVKEDPSYLNFPYHMGVYVNPGEYIGDGDSKAPIQRKNMYTGTKDGKEYKKDPFRAFRYTKQNKNGGWLSKYENGGVIEDDRGQWAHPGKITKINSNKITMKGVNYPVLGISDTGDKKMMQPGKDYKFDGKSVTEYPMAQDGLKLKKATPSFPYINRVPDVSPQVEFLKNWTNSPRGQELLSNSFDGDEKDIERVTSKRINNLDNVDVSMDDHADDFLGRYNPSRHDIKLNSSLLDTSEPKQVGNQDEDVIIHELSHAQDFSPGAEFNRLTMPFSDQKLIKKYRKKTLKETKNLDVERKFKKDLKKRINYIGDPTETRARLNSIRYFYETSPIGKEEGMPSILDSEVTPEMMEVMKDNAQFKELREVYDDDQILELLNTISDNSKSSGKSNMRYAKQGRSLEKKAQFTNFTNYNTPKPGGWLDKY